LVSIGPKLVDPEFPATIKKAKGVGQQQQQEQEQQQELQHEQQQGQQGQQRQQWSRIKLLSPAADSPVTRDTLNR